MNEDSRTEDAFRYLQNKIQYVEKNQGESFTDFEKELHELFDKHKNILKHKSTLDSSQNPKLLKLHSLIGQCFMDNSDSRVIVFVKTRELAAALECWIKDTRNLQWLNPRKMVGTGATAASGGMTRNQQVDVITFFKKGLHKIIVATPVAQEGLDVTKCNMVIQYDYNTNEIAMIQAKGRARAENSQYTIIASTDSSVREKEEINLLREKLMNEAIQTLQDEMKENFESYEKRIKEHQLGNLGTLLLDEHKEHFMLEGEFKLTCGHCGHLACFSSDIRVIKASHRTVIDRNFGNNIRVKAHPKPITFNGLEKKGKLHCKNCQDEWGIVAKHQGHFYPVIKIEYFTLTDRMGSRRRYKRWKEVNFKIAPFETGDATLNIDSYCGCLLE